jgi:26S proteasome regulatory subunit T1
MPKEEQINTKPAENKATDAKEGDKKKDIPQDDKGQPLSE